MNTLVLNFSLPFQVILSPDSEREAAMLTLKRFCGQHSGLPSAELSVDDSSYRFGCLLQENDTWFVVSSKWWNHWRLYSLFPIEAVIGGSVCTQSEGGKRVEDGGLGTDGLEEMKLGSAEIPADNDTSDL
jgi:hypothetical protein